jgi:hypothetical protein
MVKGDQLSFEFYPHWQSDTRRWSTDSAYTGVALCRLTGPLGMHQHYLCELERGIIRSVADIPQDTDFRFRMQIALSKTAGLPQKYVVRKSASSAQIAVRPLPTPELRVLTALASIEMAGQALNAKMELGHYHVVKATLASLGLEEIEK